MKKLIIILMTLTSFSNLYPKEIKEILSQRFWFYFIPEDYKNFKDGYYQIQFNNDNSLNISIIDRESEKKEKGNYQIDGKKIILDLNNSFGLFKSKKQEFILHSYESLKFVYYLIGNNNIHFYNDSFPVKKDDIVTINLSTGKYKVLILDTTKYITTENLNMKSEPNIKSKNVFLVSGENVFIRKSIIKNKNPIPKGTTCYVVGKTVDKYEVNGIKDYWYLITRFPTDAQEEDAFILEDVKNENDTDSILSNAWLFGGNINKK